MGRDTINDSALHAFNFVSQLFDQKTRLHKKYTKGWLISVENHWILDILG